MEGSMVAEAKGEGGGFCRWSERREGEDGGGDEDGGDDDEDLGSSPAGRASAMAASNTAFRHARAWRGNML
jgi:hypothetical protein